jgi:hypothetical protein
VLLFRKGPLHGHRDLTWIPKTETQLSVRLQSSVMWCHAVWYQTPKFYSNPLPQSPHKGEAGTRVCCCFGLYIYILWQCLWGRHSILTFVFIICSMNMLTPLNRNPFWAPDRVPCPQSVSVSSHCPNFTICERFAELTFPLNCIRSEECAVS